MDINNEMAPVPRNEASFCGQFDWSPLGIWHWKNVDEVKVRHIDNICSIRERFRSIGKGGSVEASDLMDALGCLYGKHYRFTIYVEELGDSV